MEGFVVVGRIWIAEKFGMKYQNSKKHLNTKTCGVKRQKRLK